MQARPRSTSTVMHSCQHLGAATSAITAGDESNAVQLYINVDGIGVSQPHELSLEGVVYEILSSHSFAQESIVGRADLSGSGADNLPRRASAGM